jgi:hypothetical protein
MVDSAGKSEGPSECQECERSVANSRSLESGMKTPLDYRVRWWLVAIYAVAMAWVEAAVVYYLRTMLDRIEPHQDNPLPIMGGLGPPELVREAATLIMLLMVGSLAGRGWRDRLGYTAIAFGIWDIFYYLFLKALCGWPHSLLDWDILFLLPLPWWGPVLAPVLISVLMIWWGSLASKEGAWQVSAASEARAWALNMIGVFLALYLFMSDTLRASGNGLEAVRNVLPTVFNWPWFCVALLLMAAPPALAASQIYFRGRRNGAPVSLPVSAREVSSCSSVHVPAEMNIHGPQTQLREFRGVNSIEPS